MNSLDIINILICPECKNNLTEDLKCKVCHNQYGLKNGIYDVVSQKLSGALLQELKETSDFLNSRRKNSESISRSEEDEKIWQQVRQKMNDFINPLLNSLSGTVCELATGIGSHLQRVLNIESKGFNIVCIDIERTALGLATMQNSPRVFCITGDARYMPIKDNSFDFITSHGAFCDVGESDRVAKEMYRILTPRGKLIVRGEYINKEDSKSYELAKSMKREKGMVEEYLIRELENAGFKNIVSTIVAEIKQEVQEGILPPVAGDMLYLYVIQAEKFI